MPNAILLTNARLADGEDDLVDIAIRDGRITIIDATLSHDGYEVEDCEGRLVTPVLSTVTPTSSTAATAPASSKCGSWA